MGVHYYFLVLLSFFKKPSFLQNNCDLILRSSRQQPTVSSVNARSVLAGRWRARELVCTRIATRPTITNGATTRAATYVSVLLLC